MALGRDMVVRAESGTGKTASYAMGILNGLDTNITSLQYLVLVPTRELAAGVGKLIESLGEYVPVTVRAMMGGQKTPNDIEILKTNTVQVVVSTPGRAYDFLILRKVCDVSKLRCIILDEADELLSRGFSVSPSVSFDDQHIV
jgi:superfamily II DNA/RNA helicase